MYRVLSLGIAVVVGVAIGLYLDRAPAVCPAGAELRWSKVSMPAELEMPDADVLACRNADGMMTGPWVKWLGGAMWQAGYARDGRLDGSAFMWRGDGGRDSVGVWQLGTLGSMTAFDEDGNLVRDHKNLSDGAALVQTWYPNGQLKSRMEWLADEPHGRSESWHANGKPASKGTYAAGSRTGAWKCWNEDGSQTAERMYADSGPELAVPVAKEAWIWPCYGWPGMQAEGQRSAKSELNEPS